MEKQTLITPHETWLITDSTKLKAYMECERAFFYRYILGWHPSNGTRNDLHFGTSIHSGMEVLMTYGLLDLSVVDLAFDAFLTKYREVFPAETDGQFKKTPARARVCLEKYFRLYTGGDKAWTTLEVEVHGSVPLDLKGERQLTFRLDAIRQNNEDGKIWSFEHKTASRTGRTWVDQWYLSLQVGGYLHVLNCLYEPENVGGVLVNGLIFNPVETTFERVLITRPPKMLQAWYADVKEQLSRLAYDYERLEREANEGRFLTAFPRRTTSCTSYFGCPYTVLCQQWGNPLERLHAYQEHPPIGFEKSWWNPGAEDNKAKSNVVLPLPEAGCLFKN